MLLQEMIHLAQVCTDSAEPGLLIALDVGVETALLCEAPSEAWRVPCRNTQMLAIALVLGNAGVVKPQISMASNTTLHISLKRATSLLGKCFQLCRVGHFYRQRADSLYKRKKC